MTLSTPKMDAYSDMQVPFEVATWARAHPYNPTAVNIRRKLEARDALTKTIDTAEAKRDEVECELKTLCEEARLKMGKLNGI